VLPLEFLPGENAKSLGLTGHEIYDIAGLSQTFEPRKRVEVTVRDAGGQAVRHFHATARVDTPFEVSYLRHGGILPYVLRQML
jgi:aconitate hydratase